MVLHIFVKSFFTVFWLANVIFLYICFANFKKVKLMRTKLFMVMLLILGGAHFAKVIAQGNVIPMQIIEPSSAGDGSIKNPPATLVITQNDNVLTLPATPVDYTLQLRYANGTMLYSLYIPSGTTQIILPTTIFGSFEIRLVADTYYYVGYIDLE